MFTSETRAACVPDTSAGSSERSVSLLASASGQQGPWLGQQQQQQQAADSRVVYHE